jgi:polysaccharide export outer membrane protein
MKLPLRTFFGLIWMLACCAGQTSTGQTGAGQTEAGTPVSHPIDATPAAPDASREPAAKPRRANDPAKPGAAASVPGSAAKPYVIGPLDVLDVNVWNDAKLSHIYDVSPDGTISMPLIGLIKADGLTALELGAAIREKLLQILNTPEVNVQVIRNNSKKYYVFGAVNRPGEYPLTGQTTVLDAFASTAGFKDFANLKKIRILRGAREYYFNYKDVSRGRHMEQNIALENGDRIFVAE